jgi:hypothetical protein
VDTVELRERLGFRAALTVRNTIIVTKSEDAQAGVAEILANLTEVYLLEGIEGWSIVDQRNKAVSVSRETVRAFMDEHPDEAMAVGDAADALYVEAVMRPLLKTAATSSQPTPITESTSAMTGSALKRPKRSRPSSTANTPMDGTGTTFLLPGGGSN